MDIPNIENQEIAGIARIDVQRRVSGEDTPAVSEVALSPEIFGVSEIRAEKLAVMSVAKQIAPFQVVEADSRMLLLRSPAIQQARESIQNAFNLQD